MPPGCVTHAGWFEGVSVDPTTENMLEAGENDNLTVQKVSVDPGTLWTSKDGVCRRLIRLQWPAIKVGCVLKVLRVARGVQFDI